jgi:uncharacterized protein YfaS (alpha-2-macroglobulin family)
MIPKLNSIFYVFSRRKQYSKNIKQIFNITKMLFGLTALLFLAFACGKFGRSALNVTNRNFTEEIAVQQNLVFIFNTNIVKDSLIDIWKKEEYIKFTPEVKGKFKWAAANELVFSPETGFKPSTDYKAEITDKVVEASTEKLKLGDDITFSFHTPYLNLLGTDVFWVMNKQNTPELRMNLNFNYPVNPAEVNQLAKVSIGGAEAGYKTNTSEVSESIQLAVPQQSSQKFDEQKLKIAIKSGLKTPQGEKPASELEFETEIPSKDNFKILQITGETDEDTPYIKVYTNQAVQANVSEIKRFLSLSPAITYEIETADFGFMLKGNFEFGKNYRLIVDKSLKGIFGGSLNSNVEQMVVFGDLQPSIAFASKKAIYLTSKGNKNVGMRITSIPKVRVQIYKIYANNILAYLREQGYYFDYDYDYGYYGSFDNYGDLVFEQTYETKNLPKADGLFLLNMSFIDSKPFKGIYVMKVSDDNESYRSATQLLSLSDIGLIVKETPDEILVFANSILDAQPLNSVNVTLVSTNNQEVYTATTGSDGVAKFPSIKSKASGFKVGMITASKESDFNYLYFSQTGVNTSRYDVGGIRENESGYQAFIYGERELYRPDETMNLKTIIRNKQWQAVTDLPIKMKVLLPNGKEFITKKGTLSKQGSFETSVKIPASTVTGAYTVEVYTSNDILLNSKYINVEEFVPDRIKVEAKVSKEVVKIGENLEVSGQALNLFGPPAKNRNYEMEMQLSRKYFSPAQYSDYNFALAGRNDITFENIFREGTTNEEGRFSETFTMPSSYKNVGMLEGKVYITVFDESGRKVNRSRTFTMLTQDVFYGIKGFDYYVDTRQPLSIPVIAVNHLGQLATNAKAKVRIMRYEWQNALENTYSGYRYVSQRKEFVEKELDLTITGTSTYVPFVPTRSGEYEIRISSPNATDSYVSRSFYAYGWGMTSGTSFEVNKEGEIDITLNQEKFAVGEEAKILMKTPFAGKILLTVERDKVYDYFIVQTDKKAASFNLPIKKEYLPNAYISATLIKPTDDSSVPLTVAYGYKNLKVEDAGSKINLTIKVPEKIRAKTKQEIVVQTDKKQSDIEVTIAAVDEGILLLKNSPNPQPFEFFYQKRALEVNSYNIYPRLFPELKATQRNYGADGYDLGKRLNPMANKRIKPVSFWSGTLKTDRSGTAKFTIDVPQFSGDLRIVAVAAKDNAFGMGIANMKVGDPLVVSTALPLFLSPNDEILVPVTLTNTTEKNAEAKVQIGTSGAMELVGENAQSVSVPAGDERQVFFKAKAKNEIGTALVNVEVNGLGEKFTEKIDMTVRPSTSLLKTSGSGLVEAGKSANIDMKADYIQNSVKGKLIISRSPVVEFAKSLNYLVMYPYGCVEQTVSTAFPQIYFADLIDDLYSTQAGSNYAKQNAYFNVQEAIRKLQTMQLYDGSLSYWQGGSYASWWGTAYAAHFLIEARKAGFEVDTKFLNQIYSYLGSQVKRKETYIYEYFDNGNVRKATRIAPKETFYSLYVLALAGRQDVATMNYYKANQQLMSLDSKYLLATAYYHVGDQASYRKLLPQSFSGEKSITALGGSFHSYIRDEAIALNALIETDPQNAQIGIMARHLAQQMKQAAYLNTQENAFGLLALGKLAKKAGESNATATVYADGSKVGEVSGESLVLNKQVQGKQVKIDAQGGNLYYFWELEGLNTTGEYKEEDSFLKVRKEFYDRNGNRISGNTFKQNDLVVVKITLQSNGGSVPNVVITDMLPAGLEIDNPRLGGVGVNWIKNASEAEHFDFRDDRINIFTSASPSTIQSFYYVCRAVSRGTFKMGPVSADAMYNGEYHSYNGAGTIVVE